MANSFSNILPVAMAQSLKALREQAVISRLVNRDYAVAPKHQGDTINVGVPVAATVSDVTASATPIASQDVTPTKRTVTLNKWRKVNMNMTDKDVGMISEGQTPAQLSEMVRALANDVNTYIYTVAKNSFAGYQGTAGTNPFASSTAVIAAARKQLNVQLAPMHDRRVILNADAEEKALQLSDIARADARGNGQILADGQISRTFGMDWYMDQLVVTHTAGTITTGLIAKAATAVAAGLKTFVATTAASTGACALLEGDVIAINGHTATYTLRAAATQASASSDVTLVFEPALERALVGSEAITVKATHVCNLVFQKDAIVFASRPLDDLSESGNIFSVPDPQTGIVLRGELVRQHKQTVFELDILYGATVVRPEYGVTLAG